MEDEKRTVMGVEVLKCGPLERTPALSVGKKVPVRSWPLAWAGNVRVISANRRSTDQV